MGEHEGLHNHTGPGPVVTTDPAAGLVPQHITELFEHLHRMRKAIESTRIREPWLDVTNISVTPYIVKRRGYQHMRLWLTAATTVTVNPMGIGSYTMNLTAGVTPLDLPEGTEITVAAAGGANAIIELTDSDVGAAWHA